MQEFYAVFLRNWINVCTSHINGNLCCVYTYKIKVHQIFDFDFFFLFFPDFDFKFTFLLVRLLWVFFTMLCLRYQQKPVHVVTSILTCGDVSVTCSQLIISTKFNVYWAFLTCLSCPDEYFIHTNISWAPSRINKVTVDPNIDRTHVRGRYDFLFLNVQCTHGLKMILGFFFRCVVFLKNWTESCFFVCVHLTNKLLGFLKGL